MKKDTNFVDIFSHFCFINAIQICPFTNAHLLNSHQHARCCLSSSSLPFFFPIQFSFFAKLISVRSIKVLSHCLLNPNGLIKMNQIVKQVAKSASTLQERNRLLTFFSSERKKLFLFVICITHNIQFKKHETFALHLHFYFWIVLYLCLSSSNCTRNLTFNFYFHYKFIHFHLFIFFN